MKIDAGNGIMGTRELKKTERRQAILDAARALILDGKERDFSMPTLAARAGVSLVTPYNLFGSKSSILLEIVREDIYAPIAALDDIPATNLVDWVTQLSQSLAHIYYRNRHFYRRMIVTLVAQENAAEQRAALEFSFGTFAGPVTRLQDQGLLLPGVPAGLVARHMAHSISGSLQHRLMERGSEALLRREIEIGLALVLSGVCLGSDRMQLRERIAALAAEPDTVGG
jgi:AcrR family transcriptional regulator